MVLKEKNININIHNHNKISNTTEKKKKRKRRTKRINKKKSKYSAGNPSQYQGDPYVRSYPNQPIIIDNKNAESYSKDYLKVPTHPLLLTNGDENKTTRQLLLKDGDNPHNKESKIEKTPYKSPYKRVYKQVKKNKGNATAYNFEDLNKKSLKELRELFKLEVPTISDKTLKELTKKTKADAIKSFLKTQENNDKELEEGINEINKKLKSNLEQFSTSSQYGDYNPKDIEEFTNSDDFNTPFKSQVAVSQPKFEDNKPTVMSPFSKYSNLISKKKGAKSDTDSKPKQKKSFLSDTELHEKVKKEISKPLEPLDSKIIKKISKMNDSKAVSNNDLNKLIIEPALYDSFGSDDDTELNFQKLTKKGKEKDLTEEDKKKYSRLNVSKQPKNIDFVDNLEEYD